MILQTNSIHELYIINRKPIYKSVDNPNWIITTQNQLLINNIKFFHLSNKMEDFGIDIFGENWEAVIDSNFLNSFNTGVNSSNLISVNVTPHSPRPAPDAVTQASCENPSTSTRPDERIDAQQSATLTALDQDRNGTEDELKLQIWRYVYVLCCLLVYFVHIHFLSSTILYMLV